MRSPQLRMQTEPVGTQKMCLPPAFSGPPKGGASHTARIAIVGQS